MTEKEQPADSDEQVDMTPQRFADLSKRAIIDLLGSEAAAEYVHVIDELAQDPDKNAVQNYLLGVTMSGEIDSTALLAKVNQLLESQQETA